MVTNQSKKVTNQSKKIHKERRKHVKDRLMSEKAMSNINREHD